jgi:hypothetical protein
VAEVLNLDRPAVLVALERRRQAAIRRSFTRLDPVAFGAATGAASGLGLFVATAWLLIKGPAGGDVGAHLGALAEVFPGYKATWGGAAIGFVYAATAGFVLGYVVARTRNAALRFTIWKAVADQRRWRRRHLLDEI